MDEVYLITASFAGKIREDFDGYVHMAREAGYQGLELFNCIYGGYGPKELKRFLADQGMGVISAHVNVEDTEGQLAYLPDTGCRYIVCPGIPVHSRDEAYRAATPLFTVYVLTGPTRDEDADKDGRFPLYRAEGVAYAARLEDGAVQLGLTQKGLIENFHLIRHDWKAGEA